MKLARKQLSVEEAQIHMPRVKQHDIWREAAAMDLISTQMLYRRLEQTIIIFSHYHNRSNTLPMYMVAQLHVQVPSWNKLGQRPSVCWR